MLWREWRTSIRKSFLTSMHFSSQLKLHHCQVCRSGEWQNSIRFSGTRCFDCWVPLLLAPLAWVVSIEHGIYQFKYVYNNNNNNNVLNSYSTFDLMISQCITVKEGNMYHHSCAAPTLYMREQKWFPTTPTPVSLPTKLTLIKTSAYQIYLYYLHRPASWLTRFSDLSVWLMVKYFSQICCAANAVPDLRAKHQICIRKHNIPKLILGLI